MTEANDGIGCTTVRHFAAAKLSFCSHSDMRYLLQNSIIQRKLFCLLRGTIRAWRQPPARFENDGA
jgi:hypothetical protein